MHAVVTCYQTGPTLPAQAYEHNFENRTLFYRFHLDAVGPAPDGAGPSTSWCDALCESLCVPVIPLCAIVLPLTFTLNLPLILSLTGISSSNPNPSLNPNHNLNHIHIAPMICC